MHEVLPGIFHWPAMHPRIHAEVSSYWLEAGGVLIDPLVPPDVGLEWFEHRSAPPAAILLSNRHHYRGSARFHDAFGCPVYCNRAGLHEFTHGEPITAFDPGDELPGGVIAHEVGGLCPDETALHLPSKRALVIADGVVRGGPQGRPARSASSPTCSWTTLPPPSGICSTRSPACCASSTSSTSCSPTAGPLIEDGRGQLQELVDVGGRTAFEM